MTTIDPYDVLGVDKTASEDEIHRAYRMRAKSAHPDIGGSRNAWNEISDAYTLLRDSRRRAHYDATGDAGAKQSEDPLTSAIALFETTVMKLVNEILGRGEDVERVDIMTRVTETIRVEIDSIKHSIAEAEKTLAQVKKMRPRWKYKGSRRNLVDAILKDRERMCGAFIDNAKHQLEIRERLKQVVADYSYEFSNAEDAASLIRQIVGMQNAQAQTTPPNPFGQDSLGRPFRAW